MSRPTDRSSPDSLAPDSLAPDSVAPDSVAPPPSRWAEVQPWVSTAVRLGLAAVYLWAGLAKIGDLPSSVRSVRAYQLLPEWAAQIAGNGLPPFEILLGLLLLVGLLTRYAAAVGGLLMVVFIIGIASAWARGLAIDCGCFGGGGEIAPDQTQYPLEIARDLVFLAGAAFLTWRPFSRFALDNALGLVVPPSAR